MSVWFGGLPPKRASQCVPDVEIEKLVNKAFTLTWVIAASLQNGTPFQTHAKSRTQSLSGASPEFLLALRFPAYDHTFS